MEVREELAITRNGLRTLIRGHLDHWAREKGLASLLLTAAESEL